VFIDAVRNARSLDVSPFVDASICGRWINERLGQVANRLATPEAALKSLTDEIDKKIRRNLDRRPDLQRKYEEVTGHAYSQDWWKTR
jgi:hypothetical protein